MQRSTQKHTAPNGSLIPQLTKQTLTFQCLCVARSLVKTCRKNVGEPKKRRPRRFLDDPRFLNVERAEKNVVVHFLARTLF